MKPALPENEAERLNALRQYQILDTPPEPAFDRIAEMAASFFRVPMAGISLVDEGRVWFKSRIGIDLSEVPLGSTPCETTILGDTVYEVRDARKDLEFAPEGMIIAGMPLRFYAGACG